VAVAVGRGVLLGLTVAVGEAVAVGLGVALGSVVAVAVGWLVGVVVGTTGVAVQAARNSKARARVAV
jgi:hypothetical protein